MKRLKKLTKVNKPFRGSDSFPLRITLTGYTTPSLNTMLGRHHWIMTRIKQEAQQALAIALRSPGTGRSSSM